MLSCEDADMLTYEESAYKEMFHMRSSANYSVGDYVREWAYTNGIKSICAMMRRGYPGTFQNISLKHLEMHIKELVVRHNLREANTENQMTEIVVGVKGLKLTNEYLITVNGLNAGARS